MSFRSFCACAGISAPMDLPIVLPRDFHEPELIGLTDELVPWINELTEVWEARSALRRYSVVVNNQLKDKRGVVASSTACGTSSLGTPSSAAKSLPSRLSSCLSECPRISQVRRPTTPGSRRIWALLAITRPRRGSKTSLRHTLHGLAIWKETIELRTSTLRRSTTSSIARANGPSQGFADPRARPLSDQ